MTRYRLRTFGLELVMIAAGLVVAFPLYVLVNLAVRAPSDASSPIAPTTSPTFANFTQAWEQGALGFPVSGEYAVPGGRRSDFEGGSIRWDAARDVTEVLPR